MFPLNTQNTRQYRNPLRLSDPVVQRVVLKLWHRKSLRMFRWILVPYLKQYQFYGLLQEKNHVEVKGEMLFLVGEVVLHLTYPEMLYSVCLKYI